VVAPEVSATHRPPVPQSASEVHVLHSRPLLPPPEEELVTPPDEEDDEDVTPPPEEELTPPLDMVATVSGRLQVGESQLRIRDLSSALSVVSCGMEPLEMYDVTRVLSA